MNLMKSKISKKGCLSKETFEIASNLIIPKDKNTEILSIRKILIWSPFILFLHFLKEQITALKSSDEKQKNFLLEPIQNSFQN